MGMMIRMEVMVCGACGAQFDASKTEEIEIHEEGELQWVSLKDKIQAKCLGREENGFFFDPDKKEKIKEGIFSEFRSVQGDLNKKLLSELDLEQKVVLVFGGDEVMGIIVWWDGPEALHPGGDPERIQLDCLMVKTGLNSFIAGKVFEIMEFEWEKIKVEESS